MKIPNISGQSQTASGIGDISSKFGDINTGKKINWGYVAIALGGLFLWQISGSLGRVGHKKRKKR